MILIVGLGNPGDKYHLTRHNIGFLVIDALIQALKTKNIPITLITKSSFQGEVYKTPSCLLLKPHTFMNLSGQSVANVAHFYKCKTLIVIHDDLDLPFGAIRFKVGGGDGGHKGLRSINELMGKDYYRLRMGISRPCGEVDIAHYVLSNFLDTELKCLQEESFIHSTKALLDILTGENWEKVASLYSCKGM